MKYLRIHIFLWAIFGLLWDIIHWLIVNIFYFAWNLKIMPWSELIGREETMIDMGTKRIWFEFIGDDNPWVTWKRLIG